MIQELSFILLLAFWMYVLEMGVWVYEVVVVVVVGRSFRATLWTQQPELIHSQ